MRKGSQKWLPFFCLVSTSLRSISYIDKQNQDKYYMTLYFSDSTAGTPTNTRICVDGNLSGISDMFPNGWATYRLQLTSRYTNRDIEASAFSWVLPIELLVANERYSEFKVNPYISIGDQIELGLYTGMYDYEIWATNLDLSFFIDELEETQWTLLQNGQTKIKTKTTVDMQRGGEPETVKYKTEPNTAQSYVIYK